MRLEIRNLEKNFGEKQVLKGISFSAESGSALGLLGRNGAGKTTTLRIIMGVFLSDGGEVLLDGRPIDRSKVKIGYLPEERGLYPKKSISTQMIYLGRLKGMRSAAAVKSAKRLLERLEMGDCWNKRLDTLSKGNQQKIQLAVTLLNDPDILVLDEPFSGLDPVNAAILRSIVTEMSDKGRILLFSSHQMSYVEEFCRNIAIMKNGVIVLDGAIREIKRRYDRNRIILRPAPGRDEMLTALLCEGLSGRILSHESIGENIYSVRLASSGDRTELLRAIAERGIDLEEFRVYEPPLNDIFVEYTEDAR